MWDDMSLWNVQGQMLHSEDTLVQCILTVDYTFKHKWYASLRRDKRLPNLLSNFIYLFILFIYFNLCYIYFSPVLIVSPRAESDVNSYYLTHSTTGAPLVCGPACPHCAYDVVATLNQRHNNAVCPVGHLCTTETALMFCRVREM